MCMCLSVATVRLPWMRLSLLYVHVFVCCYCQIALDETEPAVSLDSPMLVVGQFLNVLLQDHTLPKQLLLSSRETISFPRHRAATKISNQPLYFCPTYSHASRLCFILEVFSRIPEPYQVLRCQATTSEEELELFLKRAQTQTNHYLVLNVNKLPFKLQEVSGERCDIGWVWS